MPAVFNYLPASLTFMMGMMGPVLPGLRVWRPLPSHYALVGESWSHSEFYEPLRYLLWNLMGGNRSEISWENVSNCFRLQVRKWRWGCHHQKGDYVVFLCCCNSLRYRVRWRLWTLLPQQIPYICLNMLRRQCSLWDMKCILFVRSITPTFGGFIYKHAFEHREDLVQCGYFCAHWFSVQYQKDVGWLKLDPPHLHVCRFERHRIVLHGGSLPLHSRRIVLQLVAVFSLEKRVVKRGWRTGGFFTVRSRLRSQKAE